jgi:hypothetical protein
MYRRVHPSREFSAQTVCGTPSNPRAGLLEQRSRLADFSNIQIAIKLLSPVDMLIVTLK